MAQVHRCGHMPEGDTCRELWGLHLFKHSQLVGPSELAPSLLMGHKKDWCPVTPPGSVLSNPTSDKPLGKGGVGSFQGLYWHLTSDPAAGTGAHQAHVGSTGDWHTPPLLPWRWSSILSVHRGQWRGSLLQ